MIVRQTRWMRQKKTAVAQGQFAVRALRPLAVLAASAACAMTLAGQAAFAQTPNESSFYFKRDAGGFQGPEVANIRYYGDAYSVTGDNLLKKRISDPGLKAQMPDKIVNINLTPASVNSVQTWKGALYYSTPLDLKKGFRSKFFVNTTNGRLNFVMRNPDETRPYVPDLDPYWAVNGLTNTMLVQISAVDNLVELVQFGPAGEYSFLANGNFPKNPKASGMLGTVIVQYIPRSHVLEMYYQDMFSNERRRIFQATDIDLEQRGILKDGKALLGFVAVNPSVTESGNYSPITLQSWEFGNDLSLLGITSTSYSDRLVFATPAPRSIWSPSQPTTNVLEKVYSESGGGDIDKSSYSGDLGAGFKGSWDGKVGIRFKATARNGSVSIRYPMFLNLQFPPQASLVSGNTFTIKASYDTDALAGFSTTSPDYNFKASAWFGFNFDAHVFVDLALKNIKQDLPSIHANAGEFEFFDSDKALMIFGDGANAAYASGTVKDANYFPRDTFRSGGATTGASRGVNPLSFIQALVTRPNLAASGYVDIFDEARPTRLTGKASSDFAGLRADFTSALLKPFSLDSVVNQDLSFNLGSGVKYAFGWHLADLYGDLLTTIDMTHSFQPEPYLVLQIDDLDATTGAVLKTRFVKMALDPNGKPVSSPAILMGPNPLRVTPKVYLSNPYNNGTAIPGDPTLPDPSVTGPFNLFNTVQHLNLDGRVEFKPFELYAEGTGIPDLFFRPVLYTLFDQSGSIATKQSGDFEVPSFQPSVGKPYYFYPVEAATPVVDAATPSSILVPSDLSAVTYVQLTTQLAGSTPRILLDGQPLNIEVAVKDDVVHFGIPNTLLQGRAVHQLALVTNAGTPYQRVSNTVTLEVSAPVPAITSLSPATVVLSEKPTSFGAPVMKLDAEGKEYMELTVRGSGFCAEVRNPDHSLRSPQSVVTWNGAELPTTFVNSTTLKAVVNRTLLATAGISKVTVRTNGAGGGESKGITFSAVNPIPTLSSASASLVRGSAQTDLVVKGKNFVKGAVILVKRQGSPKFKPITLATTFATAGDLAATIAPNTLLTGAYDIMVMNPAPAGGVASENLPLTVDGFAPVTMLTVTGTAVNATTYRGQVTLTVKAVDLGAAGLDKTYIEIEREGALAGSTDSGKPTVVNGPMMLSRPGNYTIRCYSLDKVGNLEAERERTFTLIR